MNKIIHVSVPAYRKIFLKYASGAEGTIKINEQFNGVATPLNDPAVFATACIIDAGYGIGFKGCTWDICAEYALGQIGKSVLV
jgi:hypothetical protein